MTTQPASEKLQRIQISDLADDVTEVTVRALFLAHGAVASYTRPVHALTGRPGPFAYIEMGAADAAKAIKALNGHRVGAKAINVRPAAPTAAWDTGSDRSAQSAKPRRTVTPYITDRRSASSDPTTPAATE